MKLNAILLDSFPNIFVIIALLAVGVIQLYMVLRVKNRRGLKMVLNGILWFLLLGLVLNPKWESSVKTTKMLVYSGGVPAQVVEKYKDSLHIPKVMEYANFKKRITEFKDKNIVFIGQEGSAEVLSQLAGKPVDWIPYFSINTLQKIEWNGILQKGDLQTISGKIELSEPQTVKLIYANKVLDSLELKAGFNAFTLQFPVFGLGRNQVSLQLGDKELLPIHFYASKATRLKVLMLLDHPDFENKVLAEWLGQEGHQVELITKVAKGALHQTTINKVPKNFVPDILITSPDFAQDSRIKRAFADGKGILFFGLQDVKGELDKINKALGLEFSSQGTSNQESVTIKNELTGLPFKFADKTYQKTSKILPFAVQRNYGKVGVSLLNETFPLKLSGDSLTYQKVWAEILGNISPADSSLPTIIAPVFQDLNTHIISNNSTLITQEDSLTLSSSTVNPSVKSTENIFPTPGWNMLNDSLEIYVEKPNPLAQAALWRQWVQTNKAFIDHNSVNESEDKTEIPEWLWFVLILLSLTALWVEVKV